MQVLFSKIYGWSIDVATVFVFKNEFCISILWKGMCVSLHFRACQMQFSEKPRSIARSAALVITQGFGLQLPKFGKFEDVDAGTWIAVLRGILSSTVSRREPVYR